MMSQIKLPRYPGAQPFESYQKEIFFGREKEKRSLSLLVKQEPITILVSKSGMGKSSLINAGLVPELESQGEMKPLRIRFNAYDKNNPADQAMPAERTREMVRDGKASRSTILDRLILNENSLWHDVKERMLVQEQEPPLLFIFDQFEELFTYPLNAILEFKKELAEVLFSNFPQRYYDILDTFPEDEIPFTEEELIALQKSMRVKCLIAIREDQAYQLSTLTDLLPIAIGKNWFTLDALDQEATITAIVNPAKKEGDEYEYPPFKYEEKALKKIWNFLSVEGSEKVEAMYLQILCRYCEEKGKEVIIDSDIEDPKEIFKNYYETGIQNLPYEDQEKARKLIEEGLILEKENRRLSLDASFIFDKYGINEETLEKLVEARLLRREYTKGFRHYELVHDAIILPVLEAKRRRTEEEEYKQSLARLKKLERQRKKEIEANRKLRQSLSNILVSSGRMEPDNNLSFYQNESFDLAQAALKSQRHKYRKQENTIFELFRDFPTAHSVFLKFRDKDGQPCSTSDGIFCIHLVYDEEDRITQVTYFNEKEEPMSIKFGNHGFKFEYDNRGNETRRIAIDKKGMAMRIKNNYAIVSSEFNDDDLPVTVTYLDEQGQPSLHAEGNHGYYSKFDSSGREIERIFFDLNKKPTTILRGYARVKMEYDQFDNRIAQYNFDVDNQPCFDRDGYFGCLSEYLEGKEIKRTFVNFDKKPAKIREGYAILRFEYNDKDLVISETYYDEEEQPVLNKEGIHSFTNQYDDKNRIVLQRNYGLDGQMATNVYNVAYSEIGYDSIGNTSYLASYGINGYPTLNTSEGIHAHCMALTYDQIGNISNVFYLDPLSDIVANLNGFSRINLEFDSLGRAIKRFYFGLEDQPQEDNVGVHAEFCDYFEYNKAYISHYYKNKAPHPRFEGEFNMGRVEKLTFIDDDNNPIIHPERGYSTAVFKYNFNGQICHSSFYGLKGNPVPTAEGGYYGIEKEYGNFGEPITEWYLGPDGKLFPCDDGYALARFEYDDFNRLKSMKFFDADAKPVSNLAGEYGIEYVYRFNNESLDYDEYRSIDAEGKLLNNSKGYAFIKYFYENDKSSDYYALAFFDMDGQPAMHTEKNYHRFEIKLQDEGSTMFIYTAADGSQIKTEVQDPVPASQTDETSPEVQMSPMQWASNQFSKIKKLGQNISKRFKKEAPVITVPVIYVNQVYFPTVAATMGVKDSDRIIAYGDWNYFQNSEDEIIPSFEEEFEKTKLLPKPVIFARFDKEKAFRFFGIDFPKGQMGIHIMDISLNEEDKQILFEKYQNWVSGGEGYA